MLSVISVYSGKVSVPDVQLPDHILKILNLNVTNKLHEIIYDIYYLLCYMCRDLFTFAPKPCDNRL